MTGLQETKLTLKDAVWFISLMVMFCIMTIGLIGFTGCSTQYVLRTGELIETYYDTTTEGNVVFMARYYTVERKIAEKPLYRVDGLTPGIDFPYVERKIKLK